MVTEMRMARAVPTMNEDMTHALACEINSWPALPYGYQELRKRIPISTCCQENGFKTLFCHLLVPFIIKVTNTNEYSKQTNQV